MTQEIDEARVRDEMQRALPVLEHWDLGNLVSRSMSRGRAVRRRRRAAAVLVAGAVATASVVAGPRILGGDTGAPEVVQDPSTSPTAVASSTDEAAKACREASDSEGAGPRERDTFAGRPTGRLTLHGSGGSYDVLVWSGASTYGVCRLPGPDQPAGVGPGLLVLPALETQGAYLASAGTFGGSSATPETGTRSVTVATGTISSRDVAAVRITVEGVPYDASLDNGVYAALLSPDHGGPGTRAGTVSALDARGRLLEELPLVPRRR